MDSILTSIKKMLGIEESYTHFDNDLIFHINTVFSILKQIGVNNSDFSITGSDEKWSDYLGSDTANLELIKTYIFMKVQLMFDPPLNGSVIDSRNRLIDELEWRISVTVDPGES